MFEWLTNMFKRKSPVSEAPSRNSKTKNIVKRVGLAFTPTSKEPESAPYDFHLIQTAYETDSYIRQALDKYVELMFKSGWALVGKNENAIKYLKTRLNLIAEATRIPTEELIMEASEDLVKFHNAFIVKARAKTGQYGAPGVSVTGVDGKPPVAGYFVLPVPTVTILRDQNGTVTGYEQEVARSARPIKFKPEDVIHIYYKRERGYAFGNPFIIPVLDDVRLLREIEFNVATLIYRFITPLYVFKVGSKQPGLEAEDIEIEKMRAEIEGMNPEDGLVVSERASVEAIGIGNSALDAEKYLRYFEQRVFTGLGLPETVMGRSSANKGTSDNLSAEARDRIKAYQRVIELFINTFLINELLLEGGFDPVINIDDIVEFKFNEIDIDNKIKVENHAIQLFINNLITLDEARASVGKDPLNGDISKLFVSLIGQKSTDDSVQDNKSRPENQYGKKIGPKKSTGGKNPTVKQGSDDENSTIIEQEIQNLQDFGNNMSNIHNVDEKTQEADVLSKEIESLKSRLKYHYSLTTEDIIDQVSLYVDDNERELKEVDSKDFDLIIHLTKESLHKEIQSAINSSFNCGHVKYLKDRTAKGSFSVAFNSYNRDIIKAINEDINTFYKDVIEMVVKVMKTTKREDIVAKVKASCNVISFKLDFIANTYMKKAFNCAYALSAKADGLKELDVKCGEKACQLCHSKATKPISLDDNLMLAVPPVHVNCSCFLSLPEREG